MRLLIASSWFPFPPAHGAKIRAWSLIEQMCTRHEVTLLSFAEGDEAPEDHCAVLRQRCAEVIVVPGNPHKPARPLPVSGLLSRTPRSYASTRSAVMASHIMRAHGSHDAVLALQIGAALYLPALVGRPRVFEEAEFGQVFDTPAAPDGWWRSVRHQLTCRKYGAFTRHLVERCSRTTVVSAHERRRLGEVGCDLSRVAVVPNGVDADCLAIQRPKVPGRLVYSGALTFGANYDAVGYYQSQILPLVERERPGTTLHVTGGHAGVRVDALPRRDALVLTGHLDDLRGFVAASDVCVVPLRQGGGTRIKILEAMALGTPVVATSKGLEGLDVEHGVHVLVADDPAAFARAVLSVLDSPSLAATLTANARALVAATYTWPRIGGLLDDVIQEAVDVERHGSRRT
jgi:polysaccharide biosynthesis protein PslH